MYIRKVKQSGGIGSYWAPIITLSFFILFTTILSLKIGIIMVLLVFVMMSQYSLYAYYRTRNITYLFSGLFTITYSGFLLFVPKVGVLVHDKTVAFTFLIISFALAFATLSQVLVGKYKWRGRELFELVAHNVSEEDNGYTSRPHPAGEFNYSMTEIREFVNFLQSRLIGLAVIDSKKIYFVPVKSGYEPYMLFKSGNRLLESTWISFQEDGKIAVHISKADYLDYKEPLAFDQLCVSMGELLKEFLSYFQKGEEIRIIDSLKKMQAGILN